MRKSLFRKPVINRVRDAVPFILFAGMILITGICPVYADYGDTIKDVMNKMVDVVETIFKAVGAILGVYSVGQLILAFKNEDADSKSRASTMLVVAIALIAMPGIIDSLKLTDYITK